MQPQIAHSLLGTLAEEPIMGKQGSNFPLFLHWISKQRHYLHPPMAPSHESANTLRNAENEPPFAVLRTPFFGNILRKRAFVFARH
uniref:Uncharacterized protein n=1 Tax=Steinernema glaseri TaxID=37863 RepID=A0A1I8AEL6_9BILA